VFIELTGDAALRDWLPRLVGIERAVELRLGAGAAGADFVRSIPEEAHAEALTREDVTSSVHYVRFRLTPQQVERFAAGPVTLAVDLPTYREVAPLTDEARAELLSDLRD